MGTEENTNGLAQFIKNLSVSDFLKKNIITALAKGLGQIVDSASGILVAYFDGLSNEIKANSDARVKMIEKSSEEASKLFKTDDELANRALMYFGNKIISEQKNRENVALKTLEVLKTKDLNDCSGNGVEIDIDWLTQFWKLAEMKTKEEVQEILARILAKEVVEPNSVSPNTLQLLTVLTTDIGIAFQKLSNISIDDGKNCFVIHPHVFAMQNIGPLEEYEIEYDELFDLDGANLIRSAEALRVNFEERESANYEEIDVAGRKCLLDFSGKQMSLIQFTKSGRELRNLIELNCNESYLQTLEKQFGKAIQRSK